MLEKKPRPLWKTYLKRGAIAVISAELAFLSGTYFVWARLNNDRDFRLYMYKTFPWVLEGYYSIGEKVNSELRIRYFDRQHWIQEGQIEK